MHLIVDPFKIAADKTRTEHGLRVINDLIILIDVAFVILSLGIFQAVLANLAQEGTRADS